MKLPKSRRKFHRAFATWYSRNAHRFAVKLYFKLRTDNFIICGFVEVTQAIIVSISGDGINMPINWQDQHWDLLGWFDAPAAHSEKGYFNLLTEPEHRSYYSTRIELWEKESFEPFLDWVNTTLATSKCLCLFDHDGGSSARFYAEAPPPDRSPTLVLNVRTSHEQRSNQ